MIDLKIENTPPTIKYMAASSMVVVKRYTIPPSLTHY